MNDWKPIEEAPDNTEMIVTGGELYSDLDGPCNYKYAHVIKTGDWYGVENLCYYSVWVVDPTHFKLIESE